MNRSTTNYWSQLKQLLDQSRSVLLLVFKQRWFRCANLIWDDTQQSSKAFLDSPFGKTYKSQNKAQQKFIADGNANEWDLLMFTNILLSWANPASFVIEENKSIEILRNVKIFFNQLPTQFLEETIFKQKKSIVLSASGTLAQNVLADEIRNQREQNAQNNDAKPKKDTCADYCSCGLHISKAPNKSLRGQPSIDFCPNENKLDNHVYCPWLSLLCHENEPHEVYYQGTTHFLAPYRHWCLMGQIVRVSGFVRFSLFIRTKFDDEVAVHFYLDNDCVPKTFAFKDAQVGHTAVIMYAERHDFLDGSTGIRQEDPNTVAVFPCSMKELIDTFDRVSKSSQCFQCQTSAPANQSLQRCGKCRVAMYCGKECQTKHWMESHRKMCASMKYLQQLHQLDFSKFTHDPSGKGDYFSFT